MFEPRVRPELVYEPFGRAACTVRYSDGKIAEIPFARYVVERKHGRLAANYRVIFRDGNERNATLKNLVVTGRPLRARPNRSTTPGPREPATVRPRIAEVCPIPVDLTAPASEGQWLDVLHRLALGADVDGRNEIGRTPLMEAARFGHTATAEVLIDYGADINARDQEGWTPLHFAASFDGRSRIVDTLLKAGARPEPDTASCRLFGSKGLWGPTAVRVCSNVGRHVTALRLAIDRGASDAVEALLAFGAAPNRRDEHGYTLLYLSVVANQLRISAALLAAGADVTATS